MITGDISKFEAFAKSLTSDLEKFRRKENKEWIGMMVTIRITEELYNDLLELGWIEEADLVEDKE